MSRFSPAARAPQAGSSLAKALVVLLLVGGLVYFANERFRSEVDRSYEKLSAWSEEAIAADPVRYLEFVERRTRKTLEDLEASELTLARERAKLQVRATSAEVKLRAGRSAIEELRALFLAAEAEDGFPVTWRGQARDRAFLVDQLVSFDTEIGREEAMLEAVTGTLASLEAARTSLDELRARCQRQLTTLPAERELARVKNLDEAARRRFVAMKSVIEEGRTFTRDPGGIVSLDEIAGDTVPTGDAREEALRRILEGR